MRSTVGIWVVSCSVLVGAVALSAAPAQPQAPAPAPGQAAGPGRGGANATPQNLKVLPKEWTTRQVGLLMQTFVTSLGLQNPEPGQTGRGPGCEFCHEPDPNAPAAAPGGFQRLKYDLDGKKQKDVARKMIQMVMAINSDYLKDVGDASVPEKVTCFTCHNGERKPATAPPQGWGRGSFSLLPAGPTPPAGGQGFGGPGRGGPGGAPGGMPPGGMPPGGAPAGGPQ